MEFKYFIKAKKGLAIVISIKEYKSIKPLLEECYSEAQIEYIDEYCKHESSNNKFLLCNPYYTKKTITPVLSHNAVTFVDRVLFKDVKF